MDKFYLQGPQSKYEILPDFENYIIRNSPSIEVKILENVELPDIELVLYKNSKSSNKKPKSDEVYKIKGIAPETYDSYFQHAIKALEHSKWERAEYYLVNESFYYGITTVEFAMFTKDLKNQFFLVIKFEESEDSFALQLIQGQKFNYRTSYRKKGKPIPESAFLSTLQESIKFIADGDNYMVSYQDYSKKIIEIVNGNTPHVETKPSTSYDQLISKLEYKRSEITSRLIDNDRDPGVTRASLRGEREGIEYALKLIKQFLKP